MGKRYSEQEKSSSKINKEILDRVVEFFINQQGHLLMRMHSERTDARYRSTLMDKAKTEFMRLGVKNGTELEAYLDTFEKYIFGYYQLEPLIRDKDVSDIKCYEYNRVTSKKNGVLEVSDVSFVDEEDYRRFVQMVVTKNERNLSAINARVVFTDYSRDEDNILRFNVMSGWLQTSNSPFIHIRKDPKKKMYLADLVRIGFLTAAQAEYFAEKAKTAKGIYITGKGSVGKTRFLNALLEEADRKKSGLVVAESDELFSDHPHFLFQHIIENNGEGKISYNLGELVRNGLRIDLDYVVVAEMTGEGAEDFSMACYTGHICWATGHGSSAIDGMEKLADYLQRATGYSMEHCYKILSKMEVLVYLENFKVKEIVENKGFKDGHLVFEHVYGGAC